MTRFTWTAKDDAGASFDLAWDNATGVITRVGARPDSSLLTAKAVGTATGARHVIHGVDVPRQTDQLILYSDWVVYSEVNKWGVDVLLAPDGTVTHVSDRQAGGIAYATFAPDRLALSGHREAADWLRRNVRVGDVLTPVEGLLPVATSHCSVWAMLWSNSPRTDIAGLPPEVDEVRLAFAIGDTTLVGYGPYGGKAGLIDQLERFQAARMGRFPTLSVGGGKQSVSIPDANRFISRLEAIEEDLGIRFGGVNWDIESAQFITYANPIVVASRRLKADRPGFYVSWSPNGVWKDAYRTALVNETDVVDEIAQQFYDATVSYDAALIEIKKYVALFGPDKVGVGMMVGPEPEYWDMSECVNYMSAFKAETGVRKTNLWHGGRPQAAQWAVEMKRITG